MNRDETIKKLARDDAERLLAAKLFDKSRANGATLFLTPAERVFAEKVCAFAGLDARFEGGYLAAERTQAVFGFGEPDICALRLTARGETELSHRDWLGALMALGLKRETLGDIAVHGAQADMTATSDAAEYISLNIEKAGAARVDCEFIGLEDFREKPETGRTVRSTVASPRLDAVTGEAFGLSRADAKELIESGKVSVDHVPCEKPDAEVSEGALLSVRGYGRARLLSSGKVSKKGRIVIEVLIVE